MAAEMVDMVHRMRPHNLAASPQVGVVKRDQTRSRLDPQNAVPVPRRNLDELRLPALRTLALSWQASHRAVNIEVLEDLCNTMKFGSLCALGDFTPYLVMSGLNHFPEDFGAPPRLQAAE